MRKSRKNEIYETAMALFQERGYESVTIVDICEACGITKKAFYYHYASKEELVSRYFAVLYDEFDWDALKAEERQPGADYLELLWKYEGYIIDASVKLETSFGQVLNSLSLRKNPNLNSPYMDGTYVNTANQDEYIAMTERGQKAGQIRADRPAKEVLFVLFSAVIGLNMHWLSAGGAYDLKAEVRKVFDFVMIPPKA